MNRMWVLLGVAALAGVACLGVGCKPVPPSAAFTGAPLTGTSPLTVQFTDQSTIGKAVQITGWAWTFGDGSSSTDQNPSHTYETPGYYTVSLTVTASNGRTGTNSKDSYVVVTPPENPGEGEGEGEGEPAVPTAEFSGTPRSGTAPFEVQFTDISAAGDSSIMACSWTFGDGGTSTERNPSHTYTTAGTYTVGLTITTEIGADTETKSNYISAEAPPIVELQLAKWALETAEPNYVSILFQALDSDGVGVTDLAKDNFQVLENDEAISDTESNAEIKKQDRLPYTLYTVLMLDNSASVGANLTSIRTAAKTLVDVMGEKQQIAVYSFSDGVVEVIDFTGIDGRQELKDAIDTIQLGYPTTNLYGAVITGAGLWTDRYELSGISQGSLVLLTDGSDTQASSTLQQALDARGSKRCYTIGLGSEIDPAALQQLGNADYFLLGAFSELGATFAQIQANIDVYAKSLYLLRYNSPTRGANTHTLSLYCVSPYTSNTLSGSFNSGNFYSVMPGIYVNDGYSNHEGIREVIFSQGPGQQIVLTLHTYFGEPGIDPVYTGAFGDDSLCRITGISGGALTLEALFPGETELVITDTTNSFEITLDIIVQARVPAVYDFPEADAVAAIEEAGLTAGKVTYSANNAVASGNVLSQSPTAGTIATSGSAVALTVAQYVVVPNVYDLPEADAVAAIEAAGLTTTTATDGCSFVVEAGRIIRTVPEIGTAVAPDMDVMLVVSIGRQTKTVMLPGEVPLEMVCIPAGSFQMGSPDTERGHGWREGPVHTVTMGYDFYMGKYEVTQGQWLAVMGSWPGTAAPSSTYGIGANYPAYYISWGDAQAFITAVNTHITATGQGPATLRLPSEAEWEYACRAGTQTRFPFGDSLEVADGYPCEDDGVRSQYMWYCGNNADEREPGYGTKPVGGLLPNGFALHDMSGNVGEWCEDWLHNSYTGAPSDGSAWVWPDSYRVIRGGSWDYYARDCRSAFRDGAPPSHRNYSIGIRLVSVR